MYTTGSANSLADLLTAVQNACTANGWTLSGSVLHKGGCYTQLTENGTDLSVLGGTGIDGSNALTVPGPAASRIGASYVPQALAFPCTYHIHVLSAPDEVYVHVNHSVNYWQWLAFGISPVAGLPGTGGWYGASSSANMASNSVTIKPEIAGDSYSGISSGALFGQCGHGAAWPNNKGVSTHIHVGLDSLEWALPFGLLDQYIGNGSYSNAGAADAWLMAYPHLSRQPSAWNNQAALLRIQPVLSRASSKFSQVAELGHARYCRNDNYADGDIITLGADQWKIYPHVRKNTAARDGGQGITHSGTFAIAVRYVP